MSSTTLEERIALLEREVLTLKRQLPQRIASVSSTSVQAV